ncbi:hypothetical protein JCM19239_3380 [Vibrio variabilis]|uniref:Uncharacterized protein n=1 Tax=Vibrio variabilis TaxID=990271 RepID=A0ABQ0JHC3_9VIBR|nr:hypothetical protein JCM19239_3380 [Vibrio variabilis]
MVIAGALGGYLVEYWVTSQTTLGGFYVVSALLMAANLLMSQLRRYSVTGSVDASDTIER